MSSHVCDIELDAPFHLVIFFLGFGFWVGILRHFKFSVVMLDHVSPDKPSTDWTVMVFFYPLFLTIEMKFMTTDWDLSRRVIFHKIREANWTHVVLCLVF
jgi:hypothetical protein